MKKLIVILLLSSFYNASLAQDTIGSAKIKDYMGKTVTLCDRVNYGRYLNISKDAPIRLYIGPDYPNHNMTLVFPKNEVQRFSFDPEKKMINKRFCVVGAVTTYRGKPAIYVKNESQLNVEE